MASWVPVPENSDFSLRNLPYGVFSTTESGPRIGVAIGNHVLDLKVLAQEQVFDDLEFDVATLEQATLNAYASLGKDVHGNVRRKVQQLLARDTQLGNVLRDDQQRRNRCLVPLNSIIMHLPMVIGDYTDFFIGLHHAVNVGGKHDLQIEKQCSLRSANITVRRIFEAGIRYYASDTQLLGYARSISRSFVISHRLGHTCA